MHQRNGGTGSGNRSSNMVSRVVISTHACVFRKSGQVHGALGVHADDMIGGGNEAFNRVMTAVRKELDFGTWDIGNFRFKGRQICQMSNGEIVFDTVQFKHELEQIEVSKADKTKPERILNSKEHTELRGGVGSLGWLVDRCCPQLSFQLAELRRKQSSPAVQDLLRLNKVIRTAAKVIESKIKVRSIPVEHLSFMGVHDAAHPNLEAGGSQIRPSHSCSACKHHKLSCAGFGIKLTEQEDQEGCSQHFGCRGKQYVDLSRASRLDAHDVGENEPAVTPAFVSPTARAFCDGIHKESAAPASTEKRLAIELAIVKAKAVSGETDLR